MMSKRDEFLKELEGAIQGINLIKSLKKKVVKKLEKDMGLTLAEDILSGKESYENLNKDNQYALLKVLFEITNDSNFNPVLVLDNETKVVEIDEETGKPKSKDELPHLYYDYDFKTQFIDYSKYSTGTKRVVLALFRKTAVYEKALAKDLYEFSIDELAEVLRSLKAKTVRSLQNHISTIERYIAYAIKLKKLGHDFNYASTFDSKNKISDLLDEEAEENMIFEKDEIMEMALNSDNAQDGVILALLFDGVSHKNEFEELRELEKSNIDFDNQQIHLEDRTIDISIETKMLVEDALDQDRKYISINGEKSRQYKIAEGDNVIRGLRGKSKVKGQIINQRLLRMSEIFGYPFLNATNISYSGQIHYSEELLKNGFGLDEVVERILNRFSIPVNPSSIHYLKSRLEKFAKINK